MIEKTPKTKDGIAITLLFLLSIPVFYFSLFVPFETDTDESVVHYFFARYAFENPILFPDHWAKPFLHNWPYLSQSLDLAE